MKKIALTCSVVMACAMAAQATFIVEVHSSGKGNANFTANSTSTSTVASTAIGCTATKSLFGGTGTNIATDPDKYVYTYTPGSDGDNTTIAADTDLGNGDLATGLDGGLSGYYNVYITFPASTNVNASGCRLTVTNDAASVVVDPVDMNTNAMGTPGATSAWYKIASYVHLTAGTTYSVTQEANSIAYVSQRGSGVMWEFVEVPEPATLALLGLGGLFLRRRRIA